MTFYEDYKLRVVYVCNCLIIYIPTLKRYRLGGILCGDLNRTGHLELRTSPVTTAGHTDKTCKNYQSVSVDRLGELRNTFWREILNVVSNRRETTTLFT